MRNFVYLFVAFCSLTFCFSGCSKESLLEEQMEDVNPAFADAWLYSALSDNFCSFLNAVMYSDGEMSSDSMSAIASETVKEIRPLFVQTKSGQSVDVFLNSNWELNDGQYQAIFSLSDVVTDNNWDFDACAQSCEAIIVALPEFDRAPVMLFYNSLKGIYEQIHSLCTKVCGPKEVCLDLSTSVIGGIYGAWVGAFIVADVAVVAAVGSGVGTILGLAVGIAINHFANHIEVEGYVLDEHGTGMQGASVQVAGQSIYTVSGNDGRFSLRVSGNCQVLISAPGYEPVVVSVGNDDVSKLICMTPAAGYQNGEQCD